MNWTDFLWGVHAGIWLCWAMMQILTWLFNRKDKGK